MGNTTETVTNEVENGMIDEVECPAAFHITRCTVEIFCRSFIHFEDEKRCKKREFEIGYTMVTCVLEGLIEDW